MSDAEMIIYFLKKLVVLPYFRKCSFGCIQKNSELSFNFLLNYTRGLRESSSSYEYDFLYFGTYFGIMIRL